MTRKKTLWIVIPIISVLLIALITTGICLDVTKYKERQAGLEWLAAMEAYRKAKLDLYAEENEKYADGEVDVAFIGDSITDGYDLKEYYPNYLTVNRGIGGDTTVGLEARLDVSLFELQPKVVVMLIGVNNVWNMLDNYESILIKMKENLPDSEIILVSLTSMGGDDWGVRNETAAFNNFVIKSLAEEYGFAFVDMFTPLLDNETREIKAEYTTDGGHLAPLGYRVFTDTLTPKIEEALDKYGK